MERNRVAEACYKISAFTVSALRRGAKEQRCVSANDDDDDDDDIVVVILDPRMPQTELYELIIDSSIRRPTEAISSSSILHMD